MALAAAGVIGFSLRDAYGAGLGALGLDAAIEAAAAPISAERDRALDIAQAKLTAALALRDDDAMLWTALAETRFIQSTGAQVREISLPLLAASLAAAQEAARRAPDQAAPHARIAQALALTPGADRRAAAAALARSYRLTPLAEGLAPVRADAAGRLWPLLSEEVRRLATAEACMARRAGKSLAPVFAEVSSDFGCAPSSDPHSSPPGL
ncbi:MAG: hypothetical protein AB7L65_06715 [Hyphomonadaceae bacterium]